MQEVGFAEGEAGLVGYRLAPNFRSLGPRFGRDARAVAAALRQAPADLAAELAPGCGPGSGSSCRSRLGGVDWAGGGRWSRSR